MNRYSEPILIGLIVLGCIFGLAAAIYALWWGLYWYVTILPWPPKP